MHLRSVSIKGFKSFPDRTRLEFAPGVSVIVGPNGSGKSNVTEAVLWAMGEQSPLAVRGQTMQDVIFAGGHGLPARGAAEVEIVLDNGDGAAGADFSELSIMRRLERSGEGEYRMNGARCRLVDVLETLSDTGLGKESHSMVSQGKVESIIHSRPRERRLMIEEAAGLGKHRKRRRRAELKLKRAEENLSRALDVEREARSRLKPLKRQAEAAELHERLERQLVEARLELTRDRARAAGGELSEAEAAAGAARAERAEAERRLAAVSERREAIEQAFAEHSRAREALSARLFAARSAEERIAMRAERARDATEAAGDGARRRRAEIAALEADGAARPERGVAPEGERLAALEQELAALAASDEQRLARELAELEAAAAAAAAQRAELEQRATAARDALRVAEEAAEEARRARKEAERGVEAARGRAAAAGAELAAVNAFLRAAGSAPGGTRTLAGELHVEPGFEAALAAALGPRLRAAVVRDVREGEALLDRAGADGGSALIAPGDAAPASAAGRPPCPEARPLLELVRPPADLAALAGRLLAGAWLVPALDGLDPAFAGIAVTRAGRVLAARSGELRQAPAGGDERLLAERNRRDELVAASGRAVAQEAAAHESAERVGAGVAEADARREQAEVTHRAAVRALDDASEQVRRAHEAIRHRREAPAHGPAAVRRAELEGEIRAERRMAEEAERRRAARRARLEALRARADREEALAAVGARAGAALAAAAETVGARRAALAAEMDAGEEVGERTAAELRACAREESEVQTRLHSGSDRVTAAEVRAQRARDAVGEVTTELRGLTERLGLEGEAAGPAPEPLAAERRSELEARIERLGRRREQLGPVNPLAGAEYEEAVAHVEELEGQRTDLEAALAELQGLIRDTDRRIRESFEQTFEAAAKNFEDVVAHLFPGGRGRLRLVQPDGPRPVLGGEATAGDDAAAGDEGGEAEEADGAPAADEPGVEVEVTPAGKATKRLSLLSGGEKSLVALAFLFAVFLARPCPFYILDEVEAALDDLNIDRFLQLVRRYADRAQFIVVTHQKRTMDAADRLYGVSMGRDGVSKVVSRRFAREALEPSAEPVTGGDSEAAA